MTKKTAKKSPARKSVPVRKPARALTGKSKPVAKTTARKSTPSAKPVVRKAVLRKAALRKSAPVRKPVHPSRTLVKDEPLPTKLSEKERKSFVAMLLNLRDRLAGQVNNLRDESLHRTDSTATSEEDGTDEFERQFALSIASSEQETLFEIDEAIKRLNEGSYGVCDGCRGHIGKARLQALPFVRLCVACQSQAESGRTKFRPGVSIHSV